jgi:hypothetical protein
VSILGEKNKLIYHKIFSIDIEALTGKYNSENNTDRIITKISNISVEFLKQVEISGKQPYFQPNFSYKTIHQKSLSSQDFLSQPTLLPH